MIFGGCSLSNVTSAVIGEYLFFRSKIRPQMAALGMLTGRLALVSGHLEFNTIFIPRLTLQTMCSFALDIALLLTQHKYAVFSADQSVGHRVRIGVTPCSNSLHWQ